MRIVEKIINKLNLFKEYNLDDLYKLMKEDWGNYNKYYKESLLITVINRFLEQFDYCSPILLGCFKEKTTNNLYSINAYYSHHDKMVYINKRLLLNRNGEHVLSILLHELTHVCQYYKIDNSILFYRDKAEIELLRACLDYSERKVNFLSVQEVPVRFLTMYLPEESVNIFYYLCIAEREAYTVQYNIYNNNENVLLHSFDVFREIYSPLLTNEKICELVDISYQNLYNNVKPFGTYTDKNLQATVMYDLYHILRHNYDFSYDLSILNDKEQKRETLAKYGYTIYGEDPVNDLLHNCYDYNNDTSLLSELTIEQQRVNPQLLLRCLLQSTSAMNFIKDQEAFLYEIEKRYDNYDDPIKNVLLECYPYYFTEDFER